MSRPRGRGKARIKRVVRYLVGAKRLVWKYQEMEDDDEKLKVDVYVDSDWRDVDRERCRGKALEHDSKGQSIEFWRGRVLRDGDGVR